MTNALLGTRELLYSHGDLKDWDGTSFADLRYPRGTWRTLFMTTDQKVRLIRPDGSVLLSIERPEGRKVKTVPVWDGQDQRVGTIKSQGGLRLTSEAFNVLDGAGDILGAIRGSHARQKYEVFEADDQKVASTVLQGDTWAIDLEPNLTDDWTRLIVGFTVAAMEADLNPPQI
ncbi:hypothetical protein [Actinomadura sp. 9N407]|uniref:hypothetical protein n=1 Tax=Actinomadura sp. 9N407 TaxID=3375154 RepID=UPI00379746D2